MAPPTPTTGLVGRRVEITGHVGTIRYHGEITGQPGEWLGIEWDDVTRGKHNGTHGGRTYFTCRHPQAGSFVKYVPEKIDFGQSLVQALIELYRVPEDPSAVAESLYIKSASQQSVIKIETVGFAELQKSQSQMDKLEMVQLKQCRVSTAGEPGELQALAPRIASLDISRNLLYDWETVFAICAQLKDLRRLFLTGNRLMPLPATPTFVVSPFANLHEVFLNEMGVDWGTVLMLEPSLPALKELHVRANEISRIGSLPSKAFSNLTLLDLEYNSLEWSSILQFSHLESLEVLMLNHNQISSISLPENGPFFPSVTSLSLDNNQIPNWESLVRLDHFTKLRDLKFRENPVHKAGVLGVSRELLIGRFGGLQLLNSSEILPAERVDSERYFLKWAYNNEQTAGVHATRVKELVAKHGEPAAPAPKSSNTLKEKLLALDLVFPGLGKTVSKKFPANTQVRKFLALLQKLVRADLTNQNMYYIEPNTSVKVYLDDEFRDLEYFGVESGMTLYVDDTPKEERMNFSIAK